MGSLFFVIIIALITAVFADVQVSGSSVSPTTVRPGLTGSVSFTLTNTGTAAITGVSIYPGGNGFEFTVDQMSVGAIGASGSTQVNVPFRVKPKIESGVYNVMLAIYWTETSISGGTGYKSVQIPVTVTKQTIFEVSSSPVTIGIGDEFKVNANIKNTGGKASNFVLSVDSTYFILKDSSQLVLGDIGAGETVDVVVPMSSKLSTPAGTYSIPVTLSYFDDLGAVQQTTANLGTVQAVKRFVDFSVEPNIVGVASPGKKIKMNLNITNDGTVEAYSVRSTISSSSSSFIPIGPSQKLVGNIKSKEKSIVEYEVGISSSATPAYYPISVTLEYLNKQGEVQTTITKDMGVEVVGLPKVAVISSTSPSPISPGKKYSLNIQVSNIGTTDMKSLTVSVDGDVFTILDNSPSNFIGTLKIDDYSEVSYDVFVDSSVQPGKYPVEVTMKFMDSYNEEHTIVETTDLQIVPSDFSGNGDSGGMDTTTLLLIIVVIAVVAYLLYRKFFKKKKKNGN